MWTHFNRDSSSCGLPTHEWSTPFRTQCQIKATMVHIILIGLDSWGFLILVVMLFLWVLIDRIEYLNSYSLYGSFERSALLLLNRYIFKYKISFIILLPCDNTLMRGMKLFWITYIILDNFIPSPHAKCLLFFFNPFLLVLLLSLSYLPSFQSFNWLF